MRGDPLAIVRSARDAVRAATTDRWTTAVVSGRPRRARLNREDPGAVTGAGVNAERCPRTRKERKVASEASAGRIGWSPRRPPRASQWARTIWTALFPDAGWS